MENQRNGNIGARIQEAEQHQSDRFLNPNSLACFKWNQVDNMGRVSNQDAFITKAPGCDSALSRVNVENNNRPAHFSEAGLSEVGVAGDMHCYRIMKPAEFWNGDCARPTADSRAFANDLVYRAQWNQLAHKYAYFRKLSGM